MNCLTGVDGSVGRWVIYIVCVWPFLLVFLCYYFRLLFGSKLYVFLRIASFHGILSIFSVIKKSYFRPMWKQRRRTALSVGCKWVRASSRFLSSKDWNGTSSRNFCFRNAWRRNESGKAVTLRAAYLHQYCMELELSHNLYPTPNKISMIKLTGTRWADMSYAP
jgi:hypothetical protein